MYTYSHLNTRGVGRIRDSYTNPRRSRGFAQLSRIRPTKKKKKKRNPEKKVLFCFYRIFLEKNRQIRENAVIYFLIKLDFLDSAHISHQPVKTRI